MSKFLFFLFIVAAALAIIFSMINRAGRTLEPQQQQTPESATATAPYAVSNAAAPAAPQKTFSTIMVIKAVPCPVCKSKGSVTDTTKSSSAHTTASQDWPCTACNGRGAQMIRMPMNAEGCPACSGAGTVNGAPCTVCKGRKYI